MKAVVLAVLAGLCWGVGEVCTRSVLHAREIGPFALAAVRTAVALPLLWIAYYIAAKVVHSPGEVAGWHASASGGAWAKILLGSGVVAGAAAIIFFYAALSLGEISRIKPIAFAVAPAAGVLLGWLVLGEAMTARKAAAVGLILAGIVLITAPSRTPPDRGGDPAPTVR
jgi:drug/metabolite transporter (DMT)-like permease